MLGRRLHAKISDEHTLIRYKQMAGILIMIVEIQIHTLLLNDENFAAKLEHRIKLL